MDYTRWGRPMPTMNPEGPMPVDPPGQSMNGGSGGPRMSGYNDYLEGLGWSGEQGTRQDFAQGLRADGQHPWMDYWRSQGGQGGLGQLAAPQLPRPGTWNMPQFPQMGQGWSGGYNQNPEPRPMNPGGLGYGQPQGIAVGEPNGGMPGLGSLASRRRPGMFTPR